MMQKNPRFALLVGKAFLSELEAGRTEAAIAFGRAFLLALGYRGPETKDESPAMNGRMSARDMALAYD